MSLVPMNIAATWKQAGGHDNEFLLFLVEFYQHQGMKVFLWDFQGLKLAIFEQQL